MSISSKLSLSSYEWISQLDFREPDQSLEIRFERIKSIAEVKRDFARSVVSLDGHPAVFQEAVKIAKHTNAPNNVLFLLSQSLFVQIVKHLQKHFHHQFIVAEKQNNEPVIIDLQSVANSKTVIEVSKELVLKDSCDIELPPNATVSVRITAIFFPKDSEQKSRAFCDIRFS